MQHGTAVRETVDIDPDSLDIVLHPPRCSGGKMASRKEQYQRGMVVGGWDGMRWILDWFSGGKKAYQAKRKIEEGT